MAKQQEMSPRKRLFVVIPAYNEGGMIGKVVKGLRKEGYKRIIVVDDGSSDSTYDIAKKEGAIVYRHRINRGLGGALGTGIRAALDQGAGIIVTFDADGQHDPADIENVAEPVRRGKADFVIGSRLLNPEGMPLVRRVGNWGFNVITLILFGVWTTDSQSGLRAMSRKAAERIEIKTNRMEVSSELLTEVKRNRLRISEVPIKAIYTDYSVSKGQSSLNAFRILFKLIMKRIMK
ncbi:MAG: glycosyltransferase family 2 protein [Candidatus Woesearchaeota archaeon]